MSAPADEAAGESNSNNVHVSFKHDHLESSKSNKSTQQLQEMVRSAIREHAYVVDDDRRSSVADTTFERARKLSDAFADAVSSELASHLHQTDPMYGDDDDEEFCIVDEILGSGVTAVCCPIG
jgi:hypothetical protein